MLKVAVDKITTRIQYVFERIKDFRGLDYQLFLINSLGVTEIYTYSQIPSKNGIQSASLLYEDGFNAQTIGKDSFAGEECISFDKKADPLASIFYILTRMEEYNYSNYDRHGRFQTKDSILTQNNWHRKLMVERWIDAFLSDYQRKMNVVLDVHKSKLQFTLTVDIDNTFGFRWKPLPRIFGSFIKDVIHFDWLRISTKTKVLLGLRKDPYDTFELINNYKDQDIKIILFWLLGDFSKYDRNVSNQSKKHLLWIEKQSEKLTIGLHPSYYSNEDLSQLEKEKNILEMSIRQPVSFSRQHFLKLKFPETYQRNIKVGLKDDFTLGFGDEIGFRAGTLRAFPFFDLEKNQVVDYQIHPFAYMDGTFADYLKISPDESIVIVKELIDEAKGFGGNFIAIWHNESLSEWHQWKGWRKVLDFTIRNIHEVTA